MENSGTPKLIETPLAELHRAAGARMGMWFGAAQPDDFGDAREEQRFANESVALIDKTHRAYLTLTGPDRVRYLNAILTNDIKNLAVGHSTMSLLLNPQGRILAEIDTHALPDRLFCISYAMIREKLVGWLDKYIIMDDVTLTDETGNSRPAISPRCPARVRPAQVRPARARLTRRFAIPRADAAQFPADWFAARKPARNSLLRETICPLSGKFCKTRPNDSAEVPWATPR